MKRTAALIVSSLVFIFFVIIVFENLVFRYLPSIAFIYSNEDVFTSHREFDKGRVGPFLIGENAVSNLKNKHGSLSSCSLLMENHPLSTPISQTVDYAPIEHGSYFIVDCRRFVSKQIYSVKLKEGIITHIRLSVTLLD